ncbi:hypothetical protein [Ferribacterium limneticum]|uniref:hypothetical protein n=1 Tax=Ferribacterium limneticum TaxID=76259 RepID=UPI001CF922FC|nr:hypothetical protein [Ferribacterium limneticum]UCV26745.1 hypothetical protein KI617_10530 [Ferribacterium limneticum]UCV30662.1 hypothetical protein KI608_10530 [Ferribacterium limneticum]
MKTFNYELAPVHCENRAERAAELVTGTVFAVSYGSATQEASAKAAELTEERGVEYGVVRVW